MTVKTQQALDQQTAEALAERLFTAGLGAFDLLSVHLGDRLGWYRLLAADGPLTAVELAARSGTAERYAREWLEQQAVTGLLAVSGGRSCDDGAGRTYRLTPASREVLTDAASLNFLAPLARLLAAAAAQTPALLQAYRTGGGVSWDAFGDDMRGSQADMNRPWFESQLPRVLRADAELVTLLERPGARAADIGCGSAWSTIAIARAFPDLRLDGVDVDAPSVAAARRALADAGVADRVSVACASATELPGAAYDVVFAFECVHDLPHPVEVLAAARRSLRHGGCVLVMDEAVAAEFTAPGDEVERLMYGFSLLVCLPDAMSSPSSEATGTVMRPRVLRGYAERAGFSGTEQMDVEGFGFWRFYRLRP